MVSRVFTAAFAGMSTRLIEAQCQLTPGQPAFAVVGLPDKAVAESRERVRAALQAIGLALPAKRIVVNLAPADLPKEGAHYDLPIALALLAAMEAAPRDAVAGLLAMGELGLDGRLSPVAGALPGALAASEHRLGFACPKPNGAEAALAGDVEILAADGLIDIANHLNGRLALAAPVAAAANHPAPADAPDLKDVRGQERAKRALEIACAGGHNLLLIGPPGAGKSMLAARAPGLLPPLTAAESLEVAQVQSLAGLLEDGRAPRARPYRAPHHSASMAAMVGGGRMAKPGEVSLAHRGVLFLDELPEFARPVLEALRQPLETGEAVVSRINAHATYPAHVQLIAAMNPCRCGHLSDPSQACSRAPKCGLDYQARLSGPLLDRIDLQLETPAVAASDLAAPPARDGTAEAAARVAAARARQTARYTSSISETSVRLNAQADGALLDAAATLEPDAARILSQAAEALKLSARGHRRVLRVARTIADLAGAQSIAAAHIAEAASFRRAPIAR